MRPHRDLICVHKSTSPLLPTESFTPHRQHKTGRARSALSSIKGSDILDISTSRPPDVVPLWSRTVHQSLERARTNQRKRISTAAVRAQTAASSTVTHTATVTRRRQQPHFLCVVGIFHLTAWGLFPGKLLIVSQQLSNLRGEDVAPPSRRGRAYFFGI